MQPKQPDNFGDISLTKAIFTKYLKENCSSEFYLQLSIKYFLFKLMLEFQIIFKIIIDPDDTGRVNF